MHLASRVSPPARISGYRDSQTQLKTEVPVVSICAVRTGCGKSPVSRRVAEDLRGLGWKPVVVRHPMPYGDLATQAVQRFATVKDLASTIARSKSARSTSHTSVTVRWCMRAWITSDPASCRERRRHRSVGRRQQ